MNLEISKCTDEELKETGCGHSSNGKLYKSVSEMWSSELLSLTPSGTQVLGS
jgi:hypothetical protein